MGILQNIDTAPPASDAWRSFKTIVASLKAQATAYQTTFSSDQNASIVINMSSAFQVIMSKLTALSAASGISAAAQSDLNDGTVNVATYVATLQTAMNALFSWISTNVPTSSGYALILTINADGAYTWRIFTAAQYAGLRTQLANLLAAI